MNNNFEIRFPTPSGGRIFVRYFQTKKEAVLWLQKYFEADDEGKINVIHPIDHAFQQDE
jgi:hypothetical protein